MEVFSRRKLESNWDRYEASERREPDDDTPTQRGAEYCVLLESAGKITSVFFVRSNRSKLNVEILDRLCCLFRLRSG